MNIQIDSNSLSALAAKSEQNWKRFFVKNKKKLEGMDLQIHAIHDKVSDRTDCLKCANCCKTLGPQINDKDIERMAKATKMKAADFEKKYLKIDEDGDMVFQSMPCVFLGNDNYCSIYESRPKACREYPHTDRKRFYQIFNLTITNAYTCPIAYEVLEQLTEGSESGSANKSNKI